MNVIIIQPPLVQLNTPYPSGAYLSSFFRNLGCSVHWYDLSIELFYKIFSRSGLELLFSLCSSKALRAAAEAEKSGDSETAYNLRRYVSEQDLWCAWIETITALLRSGGKDTGAYESAHRFVFGAHVPRGNRMERYLDSLDHTLSTDDARSLATNALADLADFITAVFDPHFSLVRYAESLTISKSTFQEIEAAVDAPVLQTYLGPLLKELFPLKTDTPEKTVICISVPFAGTFTSALYCGRFMKQLFGEQAYVCMGGGFISTELRDTSDRSLFRYCDALCFDRGYGSFKELLDSALFDQPLSQSIYNVRRFTKNGVIEPTESSRVTAATKLFEQAQTEKIIPDFQDIDFSRYLRLLDDTNPMHRLWSDGAWLKAYLAHGCYWHQCAFCDVTLDYVCGYRKTDVCRLYDGLLAQAKEKNVYGIHFVDEAAPPVALAQFAQENIKNGMPLSFWGNIRFEKTFSRDLADYLAYGGLIGVSAGIEIASGSGLDRVHKGTDIDSIVSACCAFKEAGVLVHAYMIYGYWQESALDTMNSMETLRQFFSAGLIDSSFWHKFVLTRHSRLYKEWKEGLHPDLNPVEPKGMGLFAKNGLHFAGEEKFEKFGSGLDRALDSWMHGEQLHKPVSKWFDFPVPKPDVPPDFIAQCIARYEKRRDESFRLPLPERKERQVWLGGKRVSSPDSTKCYWMYMGELFEDRKDIGEQSLRGRGLCVLPDWPVLFN